MASHLHAVRAGRGPRVLLIHGSAADHTTWSIQLASPLRERFTLVAYDRRQAPTVEDHAGDAASVIGEGSVLIVGSSFGAVVALEVMRSYPHLCAGGVLIEPPMAAADDAAAAPAAFMDEFDRRTAERGGPAAGEFFLRTVLGDAAFERIPRAFAERSKAKWAEIRADSAALLAYRPRYGELGDVTTPVVLVGGDRSAPYFRMTLDALAAALPDARLETIAGAGHMLHAEVPRKFNDLIARFADAIGLTNSRG
jgi:pimeloyl-ACP methyl ester carboxylesterase